MSEKEKAKSVAGWEAFAERCAIKPAEVKPVKPVKRAKAKGKK
jgi:hypothetical protein